MIMMYVLDKELFVLAENSLNRIIYHCKFLNKDSTQETLKWDLDYNLNFSFYR